MAAQPGAAKFFVAAYAGPEWYAAPIGSSAGDGSIGDPWDLATAIMSPLILPGHTLYLRGGTHAGDFSATLIGTQAALITITPYPGETPIIDGRLSLSGRDTIWRDGIIFCYTGWTTRQSAENSLDPTDVPGHDRIVRIYGPRTKLINCILHDLGEAELWEVAPDSEICGCVIFNNGWNQLSNGGVGHCLYTQSDQGTVTIRHNMFISAYNFGLHAYGSSGANLKHYAITRNIHMNRRFLIGGLSNTDTEDIHAEHNYLYKSVMEFGYNTNRPTDVTILDNYIGGAHLQVEHWDTINCQRNIIALATTGLLISFIYPDPLGTVAYTWDDNTYQYGGGVSDTPFDNTGQAGFKDYTDWKALTGFDASSTYTNVTPSDVVFVEANPYGGAHLGNVAIYNWSGSNTVNVDLSSLGLVNGAAYKLRNAQNYLVEWQTFTYTGAVVVVAMTGWTVALPTAAASPIDAITFPTFGAFVVTP